MVPSDWPYLCWLCYNRRNGLRFLRFLTQWGMAVKLELEHHASGWLDLFDMGNPMVASDSPYLGWLRCNRRSGLQFLQFFNLMRNGGKLQLERRVSRWLDVFGMANQMLPSILLYLHWLCGNIQNRFRFLHFFNSMTKGLKLVYKYHSSG